VAIAERVRWGILSTGSIASAFVDDLRGMPDAEVVAVGSRSTEAATAFAKRHGIERAHGTWQALAEDPDVDVVYIATPHHAHYEATMLCLTAGRPTLTEKAFTLDLATAEELVETARTAGVFLMEAMWMRCIPAVRRAAGLVGDGAIGDVTTVHADFGLQGPFEETNRLRARALGGGALLDLGVYPVTFAQLFLGAPSSIAAWAQLTEGGVDENTGVLLGYDSGALATLSCSLVGETPRRATVTGTLGRIDFPRDFWSPRGFTLWRGGEAEEISVPFDGAGYHFEAAEVHRCLREGLLESPLVPHAETLAVMQTLDAVRAKIGVSYD
jgi:predicted dehydrogenase